MEKFKGLEGFWITIGGNKTNKNQYDNKGNIIKDRRGGYKRVFIADKKYSDETLKRKGVEKPKEAIKKAVKPWEKATKKERKEKLARNEKEVSKDKEATEKAKEYAKKMRPEKAVNKAYDELKTKLKEKKDKELKETKIFDDKDEKLTIDDFKGVDWRDDSELASKLRKMKAEKNKAAVLADKKAKERYEELISGSSDKYKPDSPRSYNAAYDDKIKGKHSETIAESKEKEKKELERKKAEEERIAKLKAEKEEFNKKIEALEVGEELEYKGKYYTKTPDGRPLDITGMVIERKEKEREEAERKAKEEREKLFKEQEKERHEKAEKARKEFLTKEIKDEKEKIRELDSSGISKEIYDKVEQLKKERPDDIGLKHIEKLIKTKRLKDKDDTLEILQHWYEEPKTINEEFIKKLENKKKDYLDTENAKEYDKLFARDFKKLIDDDEIQICTDITEDCLKTLLSDDGVFKNVMEVGHSGGWGGRGHKTSAELFSEDYKDSCEYEKYGHLSSTKELFHTHYGNCKVIFNKEKVRDKTTFTGGDSLGIASRSYSPSPINNPTIISSESYKSLIRSEIGSKKSYYEKDYKEVGKGDDKVKKFMDKWNISYYMETQMHDTWSINDVDYIYVPASSLEYFSLKYPYIEFKPKPGTM